MEIVRRRKASYSLDLAPLLDVVFLLLTFYMLTSTFVTERSLPLELPTAASSAKSPPRTLTISIDESSQLHFKDKQITLDELPAALEAARSAEDGASQSVTLRASEGIAVSRFVEVLDVVHAAGISDFAIATESKAE